MSGSHQKPNSVSLDGVRPRNAVCTACGYQLGGIPIQGGVIICPECAHVVSFDLRDPARRRRLRTSGRVVSLLAAVVIGLAVAMAHPLLGAAVFVLTYVSFLILQHVLRRSIFGGE